MTRLEISLEESLRANTEFLRDLDKKIIKMAKEQGFRAFAYPTPPAFLKPILKVRYNGIIYSLADSAVADVPDEELEPIPPTDITQLSDTQLGGLLQYYSSVGASLSSQLAKMETTRNSKRIYLEETIRILKTHYAGETNPETNKPYKPDELKAAIELSPKVITARHEYQEADMTYEYAKMISSSQNAITESLNRQRMIREMDLRSRPVGPGGPRRPPLPR